MSVRLEDWKLMISKERWSFAEEILKRESEPEWSKTSSEERLLALVVGMAAGGNWLTTLRILRGQSGSHTPEFAQRVLQAAADLGVRYEPGKVRRPRL